MKYRTRIGLAVLVSLVIHTALVIYRALTYEYEPVALGVARPSSPIVVALTPPAEPAMRRLIEGGAPSESAPQPTDLISNRDTQAQDRSESMDGVQPKVETPSEFDQLAAPETPAAPPLPPPSEAVPPVEAKPEEAVPEPEPEREPEAAAAEPVAEQAEDAAAPEPIKSEPVVERAVPREPIGAPSFSGQREEPKPETPVKRAEKESPRAEPLPERFDVAKANPVMPLPSRDVGMVRGRDGGGAQKKGELSFEANKHALGDYMLEVRRKVERTWRSSLQFQYSGTSTVAAVLECTIGPDGTLVAVTIIDRGESFVYAALCKQAIEKAAPFGPFPFNIPAAMREENLVIRWKFTYM